MNQSDRSCPACGTALEREYATVNGHAILTCNGCGAASAWPRPTPEVLAATYGEGYFSAGDGAATGYAAYDELPELNARAQWPGLLRYLGSAIPADRSVLDIGCATGAFLSAAKEAGYRVAGTDFSSEAARRANEVFEVSVEAGTLAPTLTHDRYGLVTMWHVLEHIVDPGEAIESLRPFIRPDGLLFIELPNWNSLGRRVRTTAWSQLRPPEHITFFTPRSLRVLVERHGFTVLKSHSIYPPVPIEYVPANERVRVRAKNAASAVLSRAGLGGYVRLVARPNA